MVLASFVEPSEILATVLEVHVKDADLDLSVSVDYGLGHAHGISATQTISSGFIPASFA